MLAFGYSSRGYLQNQIIVKLLVIVTLQSNYNLCEYIILVQTDWNLKI
jgi:hypothetical protein